VVDDACRGIDLAGSMDTTRCALAKLGVAEAGSGEVQ
jgi:hypothetical protein